MLCSRGFQSIIQMSYGVYFHGNLFTLILECTVLRPIKQCQSKFDPIHYFRSLFPFHFQGRRPLFWLMKYWERATSSCPWEKTGVLRSALPQQAQCLILGSMLNVQSQVSMLDVQSQVLNFMFSVSFHTLMVALSSDDWKVYVIDSGPRVLSVNWAGPVSLNRYLTSCWIQFSPIFYWFLNDYMPYIIYSKEKIHLTQFLGN